MSKTFSDPFTKMVINLVRILEPEDPSSAFLEETQKIMNCANLIDDFLETIPYESSERIWLDVQNLAKKTRESYIIISALFVSKIIEHEKTQMNLIADFVDSLFSVSKNLTKPVYIDFVANLFHTLLLRFGDGIIEIVTKYNAILMRDIFSTNEASPIRRYTAYSLLNQILKQKQYLIWKELKNFDVRSVFTNVMYEKPKNQTVAMAFLNEMMKFISKLDKEEQKHYFSHLAMTLLTQSKEQKSQQFYYSFNFTYRYIFGYLNKSFFSKEQMSQVFETTIENIRQSFAKKDAQINKLVCQMIPEMIAYNPALIAEKKQLPVLLNLLLEQIDTNEPATNPFYQLLFSDVTEIMSHYNAEISEECVQNFGTKIMDLLVNSWRIRLRRELEVQEVLQCFVMCLKKANSVNMFAEEKLSEFVTYLLICNFDSNALEILELLHKSDNKGFAAMIELKLKQTIASILKKEIKDFDDYAYDQVEQQSDAMSEEHNFEGEDFENTSLDLGGKSHSRRSFRGRMNYSEIDTNRSVENMLGRMPNNSAVNNFKYEVTSEHDQLSPSELKFVAQLKRKRDLMRFMQFLNPKEKIQDSLPSLDEFQQEKKISTALEALARFDFKTKSQNRRKNFIKEAVFDYLQSDAIELRRRAARIVFVLLSDQNEGNRGDNLLSDNSIQGIIKKIMSIAMGDPDDQVRVEILTALNNKMRSYFIPFILKEDSLKNLIIMASDVNHKIQKQAILLLEKLIPSYPELLTRFDQMVFLASSYLVTNNDNYSLKTKNYVKLLQVISKHSQFLIKNRLPVIIPILVANLENCVRRVFSQDPFYVDMLKTILKCLGHLLNYQPELAREHFSRCAETLIPHFGSFDESLLAEVILLCSILTRNSGFQLILIVEFNIFQVLMEILEKSSSLKLRVNVFKLLGTIGALDPILVKQVRDFLQKAKKTNPSVKVNFHHVLEKVRKNSLNFERFFEQDLKSKNNEFSSQFDNFVCEVYRLQKDADAVLFRGLEKAEQERLSLPLVVKEESRNRVADFKVRHEKERGANFNEKIQNEDYLLKYIIHQTVSVLFETINSSAEESIVLECLESLQQIILILGRHVFAFRLIIFFPLVEAFKNTRSKKIRVICVQNVKYFAKASSGLLPEDSRCVSKLIKLLLRNFESAELQDDLFVICRLLVNNKANLPHRFKDIVLALLAKLNSHPTSECMKEIFEVIVNLNHDDYYYLITPALIELFPRHHSTGRNGKNPGPEIVNYTLVYFKNILKTKHFENYFGNILRALTSFMSEFPEYSATVKQFLIEVFQVSGERCFNYLSLMNPYLRDIDSYQQILRTLNQKGYIKQTAGTGVLPVESVDSLSEILTDEEHTLRSHSLRRGSYDAIKDFFLINNFNKSDFNWNDWFIRLKHELVSSSHSTVLIACKNLRFQKNIMDRLFKPAFVMFWSQLTEHQKSQITRGFDTIISNTSKIQINIRKKILELVEFMSHRNEYGIVLNITKLAEFAINCHNPSKAIFFKELEFQTNPQNAIESLLNLYCEVGYRYAAEGLLDFAQNTLELKIEESWLQLLGKWDLVPESPASDHKESTNMQIFNTIASSNWESAMHKIKEIIQSPNYKQTDASISNYMAKAAFHLGKWDVLKKHVNDVNTEKEFYKAILVGNDKNYEAAIECANEELKTLEKTIQNFSNYTSNYEKFVKLQKIVELEDIYHYKQHFESLEKNELYNYLVTKPQQEEERCAFEKNVLEIWEDKLFCMEKNIDYWQEILASRNIFCAKSRMLSSYLKLSNLCYINDNPQLFTRILTILKKEIPMNEQPDALIELAEIECNYKTGKIQQKQAIVKIEELCAKRPMPKQQMPMFYKKIGLWILKSEISNDLKDEKVIKFFERFLGEIKDDSRLWHYFAIANYQMIKDIERSKIETASKFLINALQGFTNSIAHESKFNTKYTIQDLLRFLELWYEYHDVKNERMTETMDKCVLLIPNKNWILVLRQIIARLEQKSTFSNAVKNLLLSLVKDFPQYLVFPLLLAKKSKYETKVRMITRVLRHLEDKNKTLVQEATVFSEQLIRISVLLDETWLQSYSDAARHKAENNVEEVVADLNRLFDITSSHKGRSSLDEVSFFQKFGGETKQAREFLDLFESTKNELFFTQAWNIYVGIISELEGLKRNESDLLHLENISPELSSMKNALLCVPGTLKRDTSKQRDIRVMQIQTVLVVLKSKRRPRKFSLSGSNAKMYSFLLKGKEDLRLDERVMQLLNMINDLLKPNASISNQSIKITTFNVLPLSYDCGILSWLEGWDTVYDIIKDYRVKTRISTDCERELWREFSDNYNVLSKIKKLEVFTYVCQNTKGEDLKNIFWLRSASADVWLTNRNNYICSLAVMSIVGYILGLGDRHLMNIMLERATGKIVHIDFGECFESERLRDRLPEKVPFRLTRVLVNAMEACGIEGTFRRVCEIVMNILRVNKDVILTFFEEFICDPLLTWQKVEKKESMEGEEEDVDEVGSNGEESKVNADSFVTEKHSMLNELAARKEVTVIHDDVLNKSKNTLVFNNLSKDQNLNQRAIQALKSIANKLNGKDFDNTECDYKIQVRKLIRQATSAENLSQAFTGWNPFL